MGGSADVQIDIMYPGFKFSHGDQVVEVAKKAAAKIGRPSELQTSGEAVMQTSLLETASRPST